MMRSVAPAWTPASRHCWPKTVAFLHRSPGVESIGKVIKRFSIPARSDFGQWRRSSNQTGSPTTASWRFRTSWSPSEFLRECWGAGGQSKHRCQSGWQRIFLALALGGFGPIRQSNAEFSGHDFIREFTSAAEHELRGDQLDNGRTLLFFTGETQDVFHVIFRNIHSHFRITIVLEYDFTSRNV